MFDDLGGEECVYILVNRSLVGLVKIGRTDRDITERIRELSAHTGVPTEFTLFRAFRVRNSRDAERRVHQRLEEYRVSESREFFAIEPEIAAMVVEEIVGASAAVEDSERDDELLAQATAIAASAGKLWPSMLAVKLEISHAKAESLIATLGGRGLVDAGGNSRFSRSSKASPPRKPWPPSDPEGLYQYPPIELLREIEARHLQEEEFRTKAEVILRVFARQGIEAFLEEIHVGPVYASFHLQSSAHFFAEVIQSLEREITEEMQQSVRLRFGLSKTGVRLEVGNSAPQVVGLRCILISDQWGSQKASLAIALGKNVGGMPIIIDLGRHHLLVTGARAPELSGLLRSIVTSILYTYSPRDVRLVLVDPTLTLECAGELPHGIMPPVVDPDKAVRVLEWLLAECAMRFRLFARVGAKDLSEFNQIEKTGRLADVPTRIPRIVLIMGESADCARGGVAQQYEELLLRVLKDGVTAGVHVVTATQRPDLLTKTIVEAFPLRGSFRVGSQLDSRRVLGTRGAESLAFMGDMLMGSQSGEPVGIQIAEVCPTEFGDVLDFMRRNGPPQFAQSVEQQINSVRPQTEDEDDDENDEDDDELYYLALEAIRETKRASTSMIQRRLRIGYNRAARLLEIMEEKGIVGPETGAGPREILVDLDSL